MARSAKITYEVAKDSGIPITEILKDPSLFSLMIQNLQSRILDHVREIFSLTNFHFDDQRIIYVPIVAHLCIVASVFVMLTRKGVYLGLLAFCIFLIAAGRLTPIYGLLYEYVPFFTMFRNIFFLIPFITIAYIAFALQQLSGLWVSSTKPVFKVLGIFLCLGLYISFITTSNYSHPVTYVSIGLFAVVLAAHLLGKLPMNAVMKIFLFLAVVLQPLVILSNHVDAFRSINYEGPIANAATVPLQSMPFNYVRQDYDYSQLTPNDVYRTYSWHMIAMTDAARMFTFNYGYPTSWVYTLAKEQDSIAGFKDYVRYKFIVYNEDVRHAYGSPVELSRWFGYLPPGKAIQNNSSEFKMKKFTANEVVVETNFPTTKYLVYNDSFDPSWKAYINGKPQTIARTNYAFKGVQLPKGPAVVRFAFEPFGTPDPYVFIILFFYAFFMLCSIQTIFQRKGGA